MADFALDWGAGSNMNPLGPQGVVTSANQGALMGYELGQKAAVRHALNGLDLNKPASLNDSIGGLVRAGATEQASALQNLSFIRDLRSQLPDIIAQMKAGGTQSSAEGPGLDQAHVAETYTMARDAAKTLADTPEEDRPAAFEAIKADMLKRGIPAEAIDSAGKHLAGDGPAALADYYEGLLAHMNHQISPQAGAEAPPVPGAHPSANWAQAYLENPANAVYAAMAKAAGLDLSGIQSAASTLAGPMIQKSADLAMNPAIATSMIGPNAAQAGATAAATAPIHVAETVATKAGTLPYDIAQARAQADIAAQHDVITIPEIGPDGQPTGRDNVYRKDHALSAGAGGKPIGTKQAPGEAAGQTDDAHIFMGKYNAEANQDAITADKNASQLALAGAKMAQTYNPSNITPWKANMANTLNGLGFKAAAKDANNLAAYQSIIAQNLKNGTTIFPRLTNEFHAVQDAAATAKTPGDAAALALTETAAIRAQAAAYKEFRVKWALLNPGKYSERDFQSAWAKEPGANQSLFASPVFQDLRINGKPAVTIAPAFAEGPHKGQVWGIFMPGTPQKTPFRVR